uniref:Uncharacterized protein n=1 Tax=Candidatus Kentrum sp. DK TaxID=2126562 RepID=A0A450TJ57_9GAMM|nr:MAG: hypothetical protein BECKDK2373C_GA0170839_11638 [Candidatus Kentron sp. DK]
MTEIRASVGILEGFLSGTNYAGLGKIAHVEVIAVGGSIRDIIRLQKQYGSGRWKKLKGIATVRLENGHIRTAEVHWYEAHGIGKKKNEGQETIGLKR